jgi:uncharacterized membrane protein YeaQ/YmgE (transglycosylase-associated protein family)
MSWIIALVIGGIVGWLASIIMKTNDQMGMLANVGVGIVGSILGFWIAGVLGIGGGGIANFIIALLGSVLLIFILRALGVFKKA